MGPSPVSKYFERSGPEVVDRVKAVIAPYLLQIQYASNKATIGKVFGDQRTARESYLVSIKPLME